MSERKTERHDTCSGLKRKVNVKSLPQLVSKNCEFPKAPQSLHTVLYLCRSPLSLLKHALSIFLLSFPFHCYRAVNSKSLWGAHGLWMGWGERTGMSKKRDLREETFPDFNSFFYYPMWRCELQWILKIRYCANWKNMSAQ